MKKLEAYKQAKADFEFAQEMCSQLMESINSIPEIYVNNNISIDKGSSDKQYVFAIGVLNSQINASKELGMDSKDYEESKANVLKLKLVCADYIAWETYRQELSNYKRELHNLLDKDDLFQLLEAPVKP
jgi:hypothetical protein